MVFFRADSNNTIASGHIMRCMSIAKEFIKRGIQVQFIIADNNSVKMLSEAGMNYIVLDSDWKDLMSEVDRVRDILLQYDNPVMIVDTYSIEKEYVDAMKDYRCNSFCVDSHLHRLASH